MPPTSILQDSQRFSYLSQLMGNDSYNPYARINCSDAFWDPKRSAETYDMYGPAVSVANIIISVCSVILLAIPSSASMDLAVKSALVHFYTNTFSVFLTFGRAQLYLFDGAYATTLVTSPFMAYLMAVSLMELFGWNTRLYAWVQSRFWRIIVKTLALLSLLSWISLNLTVAFSNHAFIDSQDCRDATTKQRILNIPVFSLYLNGVIIALVPGTFCIFVALFSWIGFGSIRRDFMVRESRKSKLRGGGSRTWVWVLCGFSYLRRRWAWFKVVTMAALTLLWVVSVVDHTWPAGPGYVVSYGQLLSALSVVPLLASTLKVIYTDGADTLHCLRDEYRSLRMDFRYTRRGGEENLPSHNLPFRRQVALTSSDGYEPVPTTRQWILESFDLKL